MPSSRKYRRSDDDISVILRAPPSIGDIHLNVDRRTVGTWERGETEPSLTMLAKLCEIFDESFDNLLT